MPNDATEKQVHELQERVNFLEERCSPVGGAAGDHQRPGAGLDTPI